MSMWLALWLVFVVPFVSPQEFLTETFKPSPSLSDFIPHLPISVALTSLASIDEGVREVIWELLQQRLQNRLSISSFQSHHQEPNVQDPSELSLHRLFILL